MGTRVRNFEPTSAWVREDYSLTERAAAWTRAVSDFTGMSTGIVPPDSLGLSGNPLHFFDGSGVSRVPDYKVGANPSASAGLAAVNGVADTFMRSDAAPAISLSIVPTWTAVHTFSAGVVTTTLTMSGALTGVTTGAFSGAVSAASLAATGAVTGATVVASAGFGCNGAAAQTAYTVNAAPSATAGAAYTATEQGLINDLKALVNQLRAALVANGVAV